MKYTPVIGLEVHVELKTESKMFCSCSANYFGQKPNTHTCPVCLGLPGGLPYPNKKAIDWCVMIGLALNCEIPLFSKFDRKNYFYPDLSKGYQISQYDMPFCINGHLDLSNGKKIGIRRVHMEEDTGKLLHEGNSSLIDFNRSGVPLVEIVTEPDFETAEEVKEYLKKLQQIVRALNVSNADMEKGDMRLEPNISLRKTSEKDLPKYKVEVKNINSFSFVGKAIDYERERQSKILDEGKIPAQETRGWDEKKSITVSQRVKEEASDYRYFPEPDIPPIRWKKEQIEALRNSIKGKLPQDKIDELRTDFGLTLNSAATIAFDPSLISGYEGTASIGKKEYGVTYEQTANAMINKKVPTSGITNEERAKQIAELYKVNTVDEKNLDKVINEIIKSNSDAVLDYKNGKENAIMFLLGQAMRKLGKVDSDKVKASLLAKLK